MLLCMTPAVFEHCVAQLLGPRQKHWKWFASRLDSAKQAPLLCGCALLQLILSSVSIGWVCLITHLGWPLFLRLRHEVNLVQAPAA